MYFSSCVLSYNYTKLLLSVFISDHFIDKITDRMSVYLIKIEVQFRATLTRNLFQYNFYKNVTMHRLYNKVFRHGKS